MSDDLVLTAFPMESDISVEPDGSTVYDRAIGSGFFRTFWSLYFSDGIFLNPADSFKVTAAGGMNISVRLGACHIGGVTAAPEGKNTIELLLSDSSAAVDRTDRIVLRAEFEGKRAVYVAIREGWKSSDTLTKSANVCELAIADVVIKAGVKEIQNTNITDLRLNPDLCGIVAEPFKRIENTNAFFSQITAEHDSVLADWAHIKTTQQNEWSTQFFGQKNEFEDFSKEINGWHADLQNEAVKLQTFDFDNLAALYDVVKKTVFSGNSVSEVVKNAYTGKKVCERLTVFDGSDSITVTTTVYDKDGVNVMKEAVSTTRFNSDGSIDESVSGYDDYTLNAAFVGGISIVGGRV